MDLLLEHTTFDNAKIELVESTDTDRTGQKKLYMKGIFLQAGVKNHNGRIYPVNEIKNAVETLKGKIKEVGPIPGECDHPEGMQINIDRISHSISDMWMDGNNGMGKLVLLPTPCGNIIRTLLENGVKLGVSSRGYGQVDRNGYVEGFEILTVDIVNQPSAPGAYPTTLYEQIMNNKNKELLKLSESIIHDKSAQKYFQKEITTWMSDNFKFRRKV